MDFCYWQLFQLQLINNFSSFLSTPICTPFLQTKKLNKEGTQVDNQMGFSSSYLTLVVQFPTND